MDAGIAAFVLSIIGMVMITAIITTWIQSRAPARNAGAEATHRIETLSNENAGLKGQVSRLEERLAVLERIATDPAARTAHAIEQLR